MSRNVRWSAFLPRGRSSKTVFVVAMACYAFAAAALVQVIAVAFGAPHPSIGVFARLYPAAHIVSLLLVAPVTESLVLIGTIELLGWLKFPPVSQIVCSAVAIASLHGLVSVPLAFVVAPGWVIMSSAYLMWRRVSRKVAFVVIASIHALLNLIPAISSVSHALRHT